MGKILGGLVGGVIGAVSVLFFIDGLWIGGGPVPVWLHVLVPALVGAALGAVVGGIRKRS